MALRLKLVFEVEDDAGTAVVPKQQTFIELTDEEEASLRALKGMKADIDGAMGVTARLLVMANAEYRDASKPIETKLEAAGQNVYRFLLLELTERYATAEPVPETVGAADG